MRLLYTVLAVFSLHKDIYGSYWTKSISARDAEDCQLVYMCPTFCLKSKGACFVCECGDSMTQFMKSAGENMNSAYQSVYQTGSQFTNGLMNAGKQDSSRSQMSPFNTNGMPSGGSWMATGTGSQSAGSSQWLGGGNAMSGMGQWSGGQGSIGVVNQGQFAPMMTSYLEPDFQEFYRPVSGVMPGSCPNLDHNCPSQCWKIDGFSGCMHCACHSTQTTASTTPGTSSTVLTTSSPTSSTFSTEVTSTAETTHPETTSTDTYISTEETSTDTSSMPMTSDVTAEMTSQGTTNMTSEVATDITSMSRETKSTTSSRLSSLSTSPAPSTLSSTVQTSTFSQSTSPTTLPIATVTMPTNKQADGEHVRNQMPLMDVSKNVFGNSFNADNFNSGDTTHGNSNKKYLDELLDALAEVTSEPAILDSVNAASQSGSEDRDNISSFRESGMNGHHEFSTHPSVQMLETNSEEVKQSKGNDVTSSSVYVTTQGTKQETIRDSSQYADILNLFQHIGSGKKEEALAILKSLLAKESDVQTQSSAAPEYTSHDLDPTSLPLTEHVNGGGQEVTTAITDTGNPSPPGVAGVVHGFTDSLKLTESTTIPSSQEKINGNKMCGDVHDTCEIKCQVFDEIQGCMMCLCDDVMMTSQAPTLRSSIATNTQDIGAETYCKALPGDCEDECLVLDENHYFCPICRCADTKELRKGDNSNKITDFPEDSVGVSDQRCAPLTPGCHSECVVFDSHWCATCSCAHIPSLSSRDIMTGATCGAGYAHSSGTPDLAFGFCEEVCPPLDDNCPAGCEDFDMVTFCPKCNCPI